MPLRRVDRRARVRALGLHTAVDLIAGVTVEVELLARGHVRERVRTCGDGLRLQRLDRPRRRHLRRHDALQVRLETDRVDDLHDLAVGRDAHPAAIGDVRDEQRLRGRERVGRDEVGMAGERELRVQHDAPGMEREPRPGRADDRPRRGRLERDLLPRGEEDAHRRDLRMAERGGGVVVGEDPVVRPAVLRVAVGAPLAQAEAVPPAVAADDDGGRRGARQDRARSRRAERPGRPSRAKRGSEATEGQQRAGRQRAGQQQTGARHAGHGSRGAARPRSAFTERFHPAVCGNVFVAHPGMPAPTDTLLPPRYGNVRPIAHGGMGEIFLATDRELGREVAVKVLAERFAKDESLRERFKREALAAARLSGNPNIVTIFDVGEHGGRPIIVMEHLSGGSLAQRVSGRKPCPAAQVLDWLGEAAAALDAAHAAGIVHRDVKPGNLLLDDRGHVKVADFGIASAAGLDSFTQTGTILGTAGYLSPEQARGERATAASDLYALAVVAWELLAGRRPFEMQTPTAEAMAPGNAPVPSVHEANPDLPPSFDAVFKRALDKDPRARHASARDFVGELGSALHDDAGDTGWIEPVAPSRVAPSRVPPSRVAARSTGPSRWWIPVLLALLAGGALAAYLVSRGSDDPST